MYFYIFSNFVYIFISIIEINNLLWKDQENIQIYQKTGMYKSFAFELVLISFQCLFSLNKLQSKVCTIPKQIGQVETRHEGLIHSLFCWRYGTFIPPLYCQGRGLTAKTVQFCYDTQWEWSTHESPYLQRLFVLWKVFYKELKLRPHSKDTEALLGFENVNRLNSLELNQIDS